MAFSKINIGDSLSGIKKRSNFNLSCKSSFTSNFGRIIPTYFKDFDGGSTIHVNGVSSEVRLSPIAVPSFGTMELKHFHGFVPMVDIFPPFEQLRTETPYATSNQTQIIHNLPFLQVYPSSEDFAVALSSNLSFVDLNISLVDSVSFVAFYDSEGVLVTNEESVSLWLENNRYYLDIVGFYGLVNNLPSVGNQIMNLEGDFTGYHYLPESIPSVFDSEFKLDGFTVKVKYGSLDRRLHELLIGCGYGNNFLRLNKAINGYLRFNPFPLYALYKFYFELFGITRYSNFENTALARIIAKYRNNNTVTYADFVQFLVELLDMTYTLPPDYFTSQVLNANDKSMGAIDMYTTTNIPDAEGISVIGSATEGAETSSSGALSNIIQHQFLRYINANSVVGANMISFLKAHGIKIDSTKHRSHLFGATRLNVDVNAVVSTAETADMQVGDYRGFAIGKGRMGDKFTYDVPSYGFYMCLSVIVPKIGYFQGEDAFISRESPLDFPTPEFDSLGYEVTTQKQLNTDSLQFPENSLISFGLRPRYMDMKVKNHVVNGALRFLSDSTQYAGYILDRNIHEISLMTCEDLDLRKIPTFKDTYNLHRIFNYTKLDADHFIVNNVFDITADQNLAPISQSYMNQQQDGSDRYAKMS